MKIKLMAILTLFLPLYSQAYDFPNKTDAYFNIKNFTFHDGKHIEQLKIHYTTLGNKFGKPVLILHGTGGDAAGMLNKSFGESLFAKDMPLDATRYFIIIPDSLGTGLSSKPSDGLKGNFPKYNYQDAVKAQYDLVKNGLGIDHLYMIIGNSMGGMQTWYWLEDYPDYMTAAVPMASTPTAMSSRNWIMRKMVIDAIRNDPEWKNGFYHQQPTAFQKTYNYYQVFSSGGDIAWQEKANNRKKTEEIMYETLNKKVTMDANDFLYQWDSSRDFDPSSKLKSIKAYVLAINSADDERNPYTTGIMDKSIAQISKASYYQIPASDKTSGHGTTMSADLWKDKLVEFMKKIDH